MDERKFNRQLNRQPGPLWPTVGMALRAFMAEIEVVYSTDIRQHPTNSLCPGPLFSDDKFSNEFAL